MSLYIDNIFYLKIQMLNFSSLLGPGVPIELKQRGKDWHFLDNAYILGLFHENALWDSKWLTEVIFNLWVTLKSELVISKLSWELRIFNN